MVNDVARLDDTKAPATYTHRFSSSRASQGRKPRAI